MTTEEKAKAYDMALEAARKELGVDRKEWEVVDKVLKSIFSELCESEDERIRRDIVFLIEHIPTMLEDRRKRCLAWLEKQKEHSMSAEEVLTRAGLKPYKDGNQWCILVGDNIQEGICGFGDTIDEALYEFLKEILIMANSPQLKDKLD